MYNLAIILNLIAIVAWLFLVSYMSFVFLKIRTIKMDIKKKRMLAAYYVLPMLFMAVFYLSLLIVSFVLGYDNIINAAINIAWVVFHTLIPILFLVYLNGVVKHVIKIIDTCE